MAIDALILLAATVVGTWNGNWFPSGRAEHRAHPDVEAATCAAAGKMLAAGLKRVDPEGTNDVVLCLCEIRGPRAASNLVAAVGRPGLRVVSVSGYRRRDRFDMQQNVIATTLPVASVEWRNFRRNGAETAPRGFAFAAVVLEPAVTAAVYSVHLKSNYGATSEEIARLNRVKRDAGVREILERETDAARPLVIAGDFNADRWRREFASETFFKRLDAAGIADVLALLPPGRRGTHPSKRYGDSALDHVFYRGLECRVPPHVEPNDSLSDHYALFALLTAKEKVHE